MISYLCPALVFFAEHAGDVPFYRNPDIWRPVNAIVFLIVLIYILRNKLGIGRMFDNRAAAIHKELEHAKREKHEAQERLAEIESRLARLDQEVAEVRAEAQREAEREAERIREAALADADKIEQMARREMEGAMRTARAELRAFVAEHSVALAESLIRREIKPDDDRRILAEYVENLREAGK